MIRLSAAGLDALIARNRASSLATVGTAIEVYTEPILSHEQYQQRQIDRAKAAKKDEQLFILPYPPSTNTYWRNIGPGRTILSAKARAYRKSIKALAGLPKPLESRLRVTVELYPPDKRRRDLDNVTKALFDSLQHAGVYLDDSQIDEFTVKRMQVVRGGHCEVFIQEI